MKVIQTGLCGKLCKKGFNSHYVPVKKNQGGDYVPCNPEYDEIVVFNPDQILNIRFIIQDNMLTVQQRGISFGFTVDAVQDGIKMKLER